MSREIKFRAWNPKTKDMLYSDEMNLQTFFFGVDVAEEVGGKCELMQFTGLLDKNGKEIYEGDIVRFTKNVKTGFETYGRGRNKRSFSNYADVDVIGVVVFGSFDRPLDRFQGFYINTEEANEYNTNFFSGIGMTRSEKERNESVKVKENLSTSLLVAAKSGCEVIGSVYENPELLKPINLQEM